MLWKVPERIKTTHYREFEDEGKATPRVDESSALAPPPEMRKSAVRQFANDVEIGFVPYFFLCYFADCYGILSSGCCTLSCFHPTPILLHCQICPRPNISTVLHIIITCCLIWRYSVLLLLNMRLRWHRVCVRAQPKIYLDRHVFWQLCFVEQCAFAFLILFLSCSCLLTVRIYFCQPTIIIRTEIIALLVLSSVWITQSDGFGLFCFRC